ncbi:serine/threonine protein phosphatase [Corynebacterium yudongzhengii]|uniref:Serine/threonine protein phosphatase n=1 Tax=Corynebacterium yudongzhengii TaxID=2080740 RepID=A0A2U1T6P3_9CORY|nr:metallophosphoesterase family protein [Corynebacterium yudongzhengii]AWB82192.1 serine/threonine protein phosphatase [Corynebacterium yudongzhengii]PWC01643.1 serine/threonine protein phosphatase [Corynebacterium yudongzhengii]
MSKRTNLLKAVAAVATTGLLITACSDPNQTDTSAEGNGADTATTAEETGAESTEAAEDEEIDPAYGAENGMALIELQDEKPEVAEVETTNEPNRIAMSITEEPTTSMAFNWYTADELEDSVLRVSTNEDMSDAQEFPAEAKEVISEYAERTEDGYYIYADAERDEEGDIILDDNGEPEQVNGYFTDEQIDRENTEWTADGSDLAYLGLVEVPEHTNKATAEGLEPGTEYYFQVGSESEGFSDTGSFTTASEDGQFTQFIQYTDTQNAYWNANVNNEAAYGADTLAKAREVAPDAEFAVHTGDLVETAQVEDEWVDNLDMSVENNLNLPHAFVSGNHDEYSVRWEEEPLLESFNDHLNVPAANDAINGGSYYSFDHSGIHFTVLNTNDNKESEDNPEEGAIGQEQMEWARQDIEQARENGANWIVLAYHKPVYSASYHALQDEDVQVTREDFVKMADELGADLVLQGHDHHLTRTKSLVYTPDNFAYGEVEDTEKTEIDGTEYHVNPEGVTYVIPNTSGTKTYDAIYQKGAEHVHKVRPDLDWMTQEQVDYWNTLYDIAEQPEDSEKFEHAHDNYRQSEIQHFAVYTVDENNLKIEFYQVEGDLHEGEDREATLVDSYGITKDGSAQ